MHEDYFYIDNQCSRDYGIVLQRPVTFAAPTPKMESVEVPGRNGTLHFYENAYNNVEGTADCFILRDDADLALEAIARWTMQEPGYHRLELTSEPEVYRMAAVVEGPGTEIRARLLAPFSLKFSCKPQKFLHSGERKIRITKSGQTIRNPGMPSRPLIEVTGQGEGTVTVGGTVVSLKASFTGLTLDCDTMDAYFHESNKNADISAPEFPVIPHGDSLVSWSGGVTGVEITPRWWTL